MTLASPEVESHYQNPEDRYRLSEERLQQLTHELLRDHPPTVSDRSICYRLYSDSPYTDIARTPECEVFEESFQNTPEVMQKEYGAYEKQSTFFLSVDQYEGVPKGVLRVIEDGENGFKTLHDLEDDDPNFSYEKALQAHGIDDPAKCWDIGTVAVPRRYRQNETGISLQLYRAMYVASQAKGIEHFISLIDQKPYKKMVGFLGFPFVPIAGSHPIEGYIGSKLSMPVYGYAPDFAQAVRNKEATMTSALARQALGVLGRGTKDDTLQF